MPPLFQYALLFVLGCNFWLAQIHAQSQASYPSDLEYVSLDKEAEVLNLDEILGRITYPVQVLKLEKEHKVYCRILVNERGAYVRHYLSRVDHPLLEAAVSLEIPHLRFAPARKDGRPVACWVNVRLKFPAHIRACDLERIPVGKSRRSTGSRHHTHAELTSQLGSLLEAQDWAGLVQWCDRNLSRHNLTLYRYGSKGQLPYSQSQLFALRGYAQLQLGYFEQAQLDIQEGLALVRLYADSTLECELRAMRVLIGAYFGNISSQVEDMSYLCEEWKRHRAWQIWEEVVASSKFQERWQYNMLRKETTFSLATELVTGLCHLKMHEFDRAVPHLECVRGLIESGIWQRALDLRVTECLRQHQQHELALNRCQSVLEAAPLDPFPYFVKGILMMDIGAQLEGKQLLRKSILLGLDGHAKTQALQRIDDHATALLLPSAP